MQLATKENSCGTISETRGPAKGSLGSLALPIEEDLGVVVSLVLEEEADLEEPPLLEEFCLI